ncbi:MAG TPA: fumarate hydratase [Candidatus Altiarchaeales archaeon]|nr:fumarate hydratase [Candidatus Altiarchaeales archaeon]
MISDELIYNTTIHLIKKAETDLPGDVEDALKRVYESEEEEIARLQLKSILKNIEYARENEIPICQDTGILNVYVKIGSNARVNLDEIENSIKRAVEVATKKIPMRPNAVHPISRENSGSNTGTGIPVIEYEFIPNERFIEITVLPKGAGSENFSSLAMLKVSDGLNGIKKFVIEKIAESGGNPCPPIILGIGIGGTSDLAMRMAKKALIRPLVGRSTDMKTVELEIELLREINKLGIGPMGLGGKTTCLGVNIETAYCHTASLPVALNISCWANRRAIGRIFENNVKFFD